MRIALQNPGFLFQDQARNFDGYNFAFLRQYRPALFLTGWKARVSRGLRWRQGLRAAGLVPDEFEFIYSAGELRRKADVLLCFNQGACLPENLPPRAFPGLKIWHVMDFNFRAPECYAALRAGGVERLMAYTHLDRWCSFFQQYYPGYDGKVIGVPFGFGERFAPRTPFAERVRKVVAMGAINPLDPADTTSPLREYFAHYRAFPFSQMWRRTLAENAGALGPVLESFLPLPPASNQHQLDPVEMLNRYALFANDDSLCHFPPARTYEGPAAGALMVAPEHPCFQELGFISGENCLLHRPMDLEDFTTRVRDLLDRPAELEAMAARGTAMVRERYPHRAVAERLHAEIARLWQPH